MPKLLPKRFGPTRRFERGYEDGIHRVTGRVLMPRLPDETLDDWLARLEARSREKDVLAASETLAGRMVAWANVGNMKTWRQAAERSMQSRKLHALLRREMQGRVGQTMNRLVADNARYIRSVAVEAAERLVHEVKTAQQGGARPETINKMLRQRFPELLRSRTRLIARTEAAKASSALTQARAEELDLPCYIWRTSQDARVRDSHRLMEGVVVFYADPPSPEALDGVKSGLGHYHAGNCPNDRCVQEVVLSVDDIAFPARVYWRGGIKSMTKQQFKQIAVQLEKQAV
jgi:SPP1 gp7 family putative phage head morphogenesis protein